VHQLIGEVVERALRGQRRTKRRKMVLRFRFHGLRNHLVDPLCAVGKHAQRCHARRADHATQGTM